MKTRVENLLDEQLNGLLLPPKAALYSWETGLVGILLSLCALAIIFFFIRRYHQHHKQPAVVAARQLKALQSANPQDDKTTAIAMTQILRRGLNVNRLDKYQPKQIQQWEAFRSKLNTASYSTKISKKIPTHQLFKESHHWLSNAIDEQSGANNA